MAQSAQDYHAVPSPTGEVAALLEELAQADGDADPADYWVDGVWDVSGLLSDVELVRGRGPVAQQGVATPQQDVSAFNGIFASEWLPATVHGAAEFGSLLVDVVAPADRGAVVARGLVRPAALPSGEAAASFADGRAVHVRVVSVDVDAGALALSMRGDPADLKADLEAQLRAMRASNADLDQEDIEVQPIVVPPASDSQNQELPDSQDVSAFQAIAPDQWLSGVLHHTASFGAYVIVTPPSGGASAWGLVHLSEADKGMSELAPNQQVQVRVLSVDVAAGRMALSMK